MEENNTIRLDKFLSNHGFASRRSIKNLLKTQVVTINGTRAKENGIRFNPAHDDIRINGAKIKRKNNFVYYLLNKPKGIISTSADEHGRENVTDLINTTERIYPVGRLDKETHGLILLTNDGELTHKLTHPKYHVPKKYSLVIKGGVSEEKMEKLRNGIILSDGITLPAKVKLVKEDEGTRTLEMEIFEGRYRQIRRMCDAIWLELIDLKRIQFGPIKANDLKVGKYRPLTAPEIKSLQEAVAK